MGFYRTILEEEISHLDDNNNVSMDTQEYKDMIDNEEEVDPAQEAEFDDSSAAYESPDDVVDEMYFAIAESKMYWNNIMQEIGIRESQNTAYYGVYTESWDDVKNWFKKVKDWIVNFFKKVFQVIKRWSSNIFATFHTNKSFADKYGSQIEKGYKYYKNGGNSIKALKGYPYTGGRRLGFDKLADNTKTDEATMKRVTDMIENFKSDTYYNATRATGFKAGEGNDTNYQNDDDVKIGEEEVTKDDGGKEMKKIMLKSAFKIDKEVEDISNSDFRKYCVGEIRWDDAEKGDDPPEDLEGNDAPTPTDIKTALKNADKWKKSVKKATESAKKQYKGCLNKVDSLERYANSKFGKDESKGGNSKVQNNIMAFCGKVRNVMETMLSSTQIMRSVCLSEIKRYISQCRRFGNYYVRLANKGNTKMQGFQDKDDMYKAESTYLGGVNLI